MIYKKFVIALEVLGVSRRWHVYSPAGKKLTQLGFRSKASAKKLVNKLLEGKAP
jgi:hypothetical protein